MHPKIISTIDVQITIVLILFIINVTPYYPASLVEEEK